MGEFDLFSGLIHLGRLPVALRNCWMASKFVSFTGLDVADGKWALGEVLHAATS